MEFNLYLIRNLLDERAMYVGKTTGTIERRWREHKSAAKRGSSYRLYNAIRKYGIENFVIEPLVPVGEDITNEQDLIDAERLFIRLLRVNCKIYNLTDGGEGVSGLKFSDASRQRLRESHMGQLAWNKGKTGLPPSWNKGKSPTTETREKIRHKLLGRTLSRETRQKMSKSRTGMSRPGNSQRLKALWESGFMQSRLPVPWNKGKTGLQEAWNKGKRHTHCNKGHEFTPENTHLRIDGAQECRTCRRASIKVYVLRHHEQVLARRRQRRKELWQPHLISTNQIQTQAA